MHTYVVSSSIQLYIELPPQLFILADPARIDRVVLNLLANAIKFTGGYRDGDGAITVTLRAEGADALLEVADNGIGISAAGLTRIGERWVRDVRHERMPPGTGLGLNFSTAMVRLFHGTIEVFSPGERQGTMVRVRLPLAPGDSPCPTISTSLRTTAR
nr:ATP-binding protein [Oscillochloris sp. ZM17-4]